MSDYIEATSFKATLENFFDQFKSFLNGKDLPEKLPTGQLPYHPGDNAILVDPDINVPNAGTLIDINEIADILYKIVYAFRSIHWVNSYWYHGTHDWSTLKSSTSGYLNTIDDVPARSATASGTYSNNAASAQEVGAYFSDTIHKGDLITRQSLNDMMTLLLNQWKANITTINYTYWTCHYNCHSNYVNRVRR